MPQGCDWDCYDSKNKMTPVSSASLAKESAKVGANNSSSSAIRAPTMPQDNSLPMSKPTR
jgi:hypothetical protein